MKRNGKDNRDSRHELSNDFLRMLSEDWQQNGKASLEKVREKTPDRYCELIAKVVPKEMLIASDQTGEALGPNKAKVYGVLRYCLLSFSGRITNATRILMPRVVTSRKKSRISLSHVRSMG